MMATATVKKREMALRNLATGNIFHARSSNGASLVCLVTAIDHGTIYARRIHTQDDMLFDRNTGLAVAKHHTRIDCVEPFPPDVHKIFAGMDRKYRKMMALVRQGVELSPEQRKMTPDEKRANLSINPHVSANPI